MAPHLPFEDGVLYWPLAWPDSDAIPTDNLDSGLYRAIVLYQTR